MSANVQPEPSLVNALAASVELEVLIAPLPLESRCALRSLVQRFVREAAPADDSPECPDAAAYWREHGPDAFAGTGLPADEPEVAVTFSPNVRQVTGNRWNAVVTRSDGGRPYRVGTFRNADSAWNAAEQLAAELRSDVR
jgi:hypothetical protein